MFNRQYSDMFRVQKGSSLLEGKNFVDNNSYRTLYCGKYIRKKLSVTQTNFHLLSNKGPDPGNAEGVLIRKLIKVNSGCFAYEETRITRDANHALPRVHTTLSRIPDFNVDLFVPIREDSMRKNFWRIPNVVGFSLHSRVAECGFSKKLFQKTSITENTLYKAV